MRVDLVKHSNFKLHKIIIRCYITTLQWNKNFVKIIFHFSNFLQHGINFEIVFFVDLDML